MSALYPEKNATPLTQGTADAALTPVIRSITFADLHDALRLGWEDFKAVPSHPVILCLYVIYPMLSLVLVGMVLGYSVLPLLFPLVAGFALMGPFAALGLYELSRRRELGEATSAWHATQVLRSPSFGAMLGLGTLLLMIFVVWVATAQAIYVSTFGNAPPTGIPNFVTRVLTTPEGWELIVVGCGVGFLFSVVALCISVVSFPLMHDRHASAAAAMTTSFRAVAQNPVPMAAWGLIVAVLLLLGSMSLFLGRAVVIPLLGHSTWHLYRKVVERNPNLPEMPPVAQASFADDGDKVVGTWKLVSYEVEVQATGQKGPVMGEKPTGYATFSSEGRVFFVLTGEARKAAKTDQERAELLNTLVAIVKLFTSVRRDLSYSSEKVRTCCTMDSDLYLNQTMEFDHVDA
jgi:uncharacterized membrane protein